MILVFAVLSVLFGVFMLSAVLTPLYQITEVTFRVVQALFSGAVLVPLLGVPILVYRENERELAEANVVFRRFVPQEFLSFLGVERFTEIRAGQQIETELTVLFCDVRSFTALSEGMSPVDVMALLNRYLELVGPVVRRFGGFVDKYMGDGVMALFPVDDAGSDGSRRNAALAATGILSALEQAWPDGTVRVSIGIHTGNAMLGTVGEHDRLDSTVVGDAVNTASRIQSIAGEYGIEVLASSEALPPASTGLHARFVDRVRLKGKQVPTELVEITSVPPDEAFLKAQRHYESAFRALAAGDLKGARVEILRACQLSPEHRVFSVLAERIDSFRVSGLPPAWDGAYTRESK